MDYADLCHAGTTALFYLQKCHQVSCKNSLTQFFQNTKHILKSKFILSFSYNRMIKKWFCFQSPPLSGMLRLHCNEGKENQTRTTVTATTATEMVLSGQTGLQVCVPSTPVQTDSESLQRYVCVQKLTKGFQKHRMHEKV